MESTVSGLLRRAKRLDPSSNRGEFIAILEKAIELDPFMAEPYIFLGLFYFKEQEWDLACRELSEGLNLDCTTSNKMELAEQAYVALGKTYRKLNNKEKSLLCFRTLIGLYPNSLISQKLAEQLYGKMNISAEWLPYYKMGCEAFAKDNLEEAERLLEESARLNDIFPWTQYQMGLIYQQKGEFELASITLLQAIEEERHYLFCNALALACYKLSKKDEERKCIAEALSLNNHYAATLIHFMDLAIEADDKDRVYFLAEIIKNQMPESPYAFQVDSIISSLDGSAKFGIHDTNVLDDLPIDIDIDIDIDEIAGPLEEFPSSNFEEISIREIEKAAAESASRNVATEELLSLPPEVLSEYEKHIGESGKHDDQILKKISITPYENDTNSATIESDSPSGKLKLEVSSRESGKLSLEISAEPSGKLNKETDNKPTVIEEVEETLPTEDYTLSEAKVVKQDSAKLRKDIVYDESGKLKIEISSGEPSGKLRRDVLPEKPIMPRQEVVAESKYEKTGVVSSLMSIMSKIDGITDKRKNVDREIKSEICSVIRDEFLQLKREHNDEIAKLTQEFIKMTEQVILSMQRMESAFMTISGTCLKQTMPQVLSSENKVNLETVKSISKEEVENDKIELEHPSEKIADTPSEAVNIPSESDISIESDVPLESELPVEQTEVSAESDSQAKPKKQKRKKKK